ncbi:MAG: hypothetical protein LBM65_04660 [Oscillospiraceae bacterium]|jgi:predicted DNA-binding protein YlxM (UPF0122 family)|nr:hypothetical protein [Oscillospiraceae bacterium]
MKQRKIYFSDKNSDKIAFSLYGKGGTNAKQREQMKKILLLAIGTELTQKQKFCITQFYINGKKMNQIAAEMSVHPSTVTRHIKKGTERLQNIARYYE